VGGPDTQPCRDIFFDVADHKPSRHVEGAELRDDAEARLEAIAVTSLSKSKRRRGDAAPCVEIEPKGGLIACDQAAWDCVTSAVVR
jgi:hypothetical protein